MTDEQVKKLIRASLKGAARALREELEKRDLRIRELENHSESTAVCLDDVRRQVHDLQEELQRQKAMH